MEDFEVLSRHSRRESVKKGLKSSQRVAGSPVEIPTWYLPGSDIKRYRSTNLLDNGPKRILVYYGLKKWKWIRVGFIDPFSGLIPLEEEKWVELGEDRIHD